MQRYFDVLPGLLPVPIEPLLPLSEPDMPAAPELLSDPDVPFEFDMSLEPDAPVEPDMPFEPDVPLEPLLLSEPDMPLEPLLLSELDMPPEELSVEPVAPVAPPVPEAPEASDPALMPLEEPPAAPDVESLLDWATATLETRPNNNALNNFPFMVRVISCSSIGKD